MKVTLLDPEKKPLAGGKLVTRTGSDVPVRWKRGFSHGALRGRPVRVGGIVVRPGDLLHGDANGVMSIPLEIATELPEVAARFAAAERILLDYVQGPGLRLVELRSAHGGRTGRRSRASSR